MNHLLRIHRLCNGCKKNSEGCSGMELIKMNRRRTMLMKQSKTMERRSKVRIVEEPISGGSQAIK